MSAFACAASLCDAAHGEFSSDPAEHGVITASLVSHLLLTAQGKMEKGLLFQVFMYGCQQIKAGEACVKRGKGNKWARFEVGLTAT